jgi:hypothetical protein
VKITIPKLIFAAATAAAILCCGIPASRAATYGDDKWCAVSNDGGDAINWNCQFDTVDDCSPAILAGNRGFCAINPYWRPPEPAPNPQPQR